MGETSQSIKKHMYKHRKTMKIGNDKNPLVKHNLRTKDSKMLINIHYKQHKKIDESSIITNCNTVKQKPSFFSTNLLI